MKARQPKEDSYSKKKRNFLPMKIKQKTNLYSFKIDNSIHDENKNIINTKSGKGEKAEEKIPNLKENTKTNIIKDTEAFIKPQSEYSYKKNIIKPQALKTKIKRIHNSFSSESKGYLIIIILSLFFHCFSYELKHRKIFYNYLDITIKLEGNGILNVFYGGDSCDQEIFSRPDEVYINLVKQNEVNDKYDFDFPFNIVKLR